MLAADQEARSVGKLEPHAAVSARDERALAVTTGAHAPKSVFRDRSIRHGFDPANGKPRDWPLRFSVVSWSATLEGLAPGAYEFRPRAVDLNGFAQPEPANDAIYTTQRLQCQGQIRFGPAGRASAAAVWLGAPCAELFQDQRPDDTVDLAIGTEFSQLSHNDDIDAVLASLRPDATKPTDAALLSKIHTAGC